MNINFEKRRKEIAELKNSGISVIEISKRYNISRQAVYLLLKKVVRDGDKVTYNRFKKRINKCEVCQKTFHGSSKLIKTCSAECNSLLRRSRTSPDSKWSRYAVITLICDTCSKSFERAKYFDSLSKHYVKHKKYKNNYCSRYCYHNRNNK